MDELGAHCAKWTKPDTEEQKLHCNMYMRNLRYSYS